MPLGQNHPVNSTTIETNHRECSLLNDTSVVNDAVVNKTIVTTRI